MAVAESPATVGRRSVGFNVGGIDQSNFDPERGTVKGISKAVILMPEVSGDRGRS